MDAQQIIEYIRTSEKKTPVKVYVWEKTPVDFPNCRVFPAAPGCKIVFGDWKDVGPVLEANTFDHVEIEYIQTAGRYCPYIDWQISPCAVARYLVQLGVDGREHQAACLYFRR